MKIASQTNLINKLSRLLKPLIKFLFPEVSSLSIHKEITMNIVANVMGLGNAATPLGLKAMSSLQKINNTKDRLSDPMIMLIAINTASLQIIPTTVIAIRTSLR